MLNGHCAALWVDCWDQQKHSLSRDIQKDHSLRDFLLNARKQIVAIANKAVLRVDATLVLEYVYCL